MPESEDTVMERKNDEKWVAVWGNAISIRERRPENYGKHLTLRYPMTMMLDGKAIRVTFDNFCGNEPVTIHHASVARSVRGAEVSDSVPLTFDGSRSVTLPAGARLQSDPLPFPVRRGEKIAVSMYFEGFTEMRSAVIITGPLSEGYFAVGDYADEDILPLEYSKKINCFYFLSDIDILTSPDNHCIVCYGDSITAQAWPDHLIQKTLNEGDGNVSIIRKAASGTRILRQYDNVTYESYGLKGSIRFPHEFPVTGADHVIIQHGINDIIHPVGTDVNPFRPWSDLPTAEEMIAGLRQYIAWAREMGMKIWLGTLLPIEGWRTYADFREELRTAINAWMRTTNEADGCIDFDKAVCDSSHPARFAPGYDSGDHLHPSDAAYRRMAEEAYHVIFQKEHCPHENGA